MSLVGIIANPASGKDIRRLVAYGSVFDNQEKVRIVRRVLLGLLAAGVERVCFMPDYFGIVRRASDGLKADIPIFPANFKATAGQADSITAAKIMEEKGASCIVTRGGDGTNRAVAKGSTRVPILPVSTGTNNVFPYMIEGTLAGLAAGLVAGNQVPLSESTISSTKLEVVMDGEAVDLALVDAAVYDDPFIGSRAIWDMTKVRQIFLNRSQPDSIGLSSIGGQLHPIKADDHRGLSLTLGENGRRVTAPIAPGIIESVCIEHEQIINPGEEVPIAWTPSVLALDGEREIELRQGQQAFIRLVKDGPLVVDVTRTMTAAMKRELFISDKTADGAAVLNQRTQ